MEIFRYRYNCLLTRKQDYIIAGPKLRCSTRLKESAPLTENEGGLWDHRGRSILSSRPEPKPAEIPNVKERVARLYCNMILQETRGRVGKAVDIAGIHPRGMYNKMKRLGIRKVDFR